MVVDWAEVDPTPFVAKESASFVQHVGHTVLLVVRIEFHFTLDVEGAAARMQDVELGPSAIGDEADVARSGVRVPGVKEIGRIANGERAEARAHEVLGGEGPCITPMDPAAALVERASSTARAQRRSRWQRMGRHRTIVPYSVGRPGIGSFVWVGAGRSLASQLLTTPLTNLPG